ncbi:hypothetical protein [Chryseobacterium sp.]|uniref:hypothetical protein n=1 Tax=Chryseobacterium sp. TaxID=1871047 RepID=UPI000EC65A0C|nr:hypothetical protein [Chryseobacterium sp.]HCA09276.1 hypothetical protein [Chryseobacterium sp.]
MAKTKKLNLNDIQVNTDNYRFEPVASQKEAIDTMLIDQNEKLFKLAEHIVSFGLNPNDSIQVIKSEHDKTKYNVLEGNRRTVTLKILSNPDLVDNPSLINLKTKFKKLNEENKNKIITVLDCTVYDSPEEADRWIKLKHAGQQDGIGTVTWNAQQIDRFEEKVEGKASTSLQIIRLLENSSNVEKNLKENLNKLPVSNLERLISDPKARETLGISITNGVIQSTVDRDEVVKGLEYIVKDMLKPDFSVKKIYTKEDRLDYLNKIPQNFKPNTTKKSEKPWQFNNSEFKQAPVPSMVKPIPKDRKTLIPKSCKIQIKNPKVNQLYHDLQKLDIDKYPNTIAIAFRAFVEFSVDCYLEENNITTTKDGRSQIDKNTNLKTKIIEVANDLETKKIADKHVCKGIRSAVNNSNDLMGIETLHAYVHNNKFQAIPNYLITTWDNIQSFIEKTWLNIA